MIYYSRSHSPRAVFPLVPSSPPPVHPVRCTVHSGMSDSLPPHGLYPARLLCPWDSPGKNTGVGCHTLLQGIFPTQGSNPHLAHYRRILYHLSHQGSPEILEWVACPVSRGSSQSRNRTGISCIAAWILYQLSYQGSPAML